MKKLKIYLDTSVIGGSFDDGFKDHSPEFPLIFTHYTESKVFYQSFSWFFPASGLDSTSAR